MAVMESSTKRIPSSEWLRRKSVSRRMYLGEKRSLKEIIQALAYDGFNPSENQLEYQLKLWGIHKNIPKRLAEATWQYIGYEIAARKARGEDTEVVVFGQVQGRKKIETETRRWYKFRYGSEPVPRLPEGISILLRKPSSSQPIPWPSALPWLQFQSKCEYAHPWDLPPLFIAAHFACQVDDLSVLDLLIASGATISHHSVMQYGFLSKVTFMTLLAGKKDEDIGLDIMKMAIATFADIAFDGGAQDFDATDILISAASRGNVKILKFLYDNKFSMTGANPFGLTALHAAAYEGQIKCCKFLLECGVGTGYCNPAIPSPIHLACYQNRAKVVKLLHMHGMRIDCKLSIPEKQRALVLQRYFCHNGPKMLSLLNRSESYKLATVTNILQRLQSPIDAVLYTDWERFARGVASSRRPPFFSHDYRSRSTLVSYLVRNGAVIPSSAVSCAAFYVDTELLSLALRSGIDPNANYWRPYSHWSSLGLSLLKHDNPKRRAELATILLNNGYKVAEADVEYAIRFGDIRLVRKTLRYFLHDDCHPPSLGPSMLEAALEVGGSLTIQEVLKYDLVCYSPSLLCVATYRAVTGLINSEVVSQILRLRSQDSTSKESIKIESTAVGIAACYEDMEILDLLLAHVPVSNIAYTSISISEILTEIEGIHGSHMKNVIENAYSKPGNTSRHHLCCSVLVYALDSSSEILHKLLDHGYKFDWIGVAIMTRLRRCDWHVNIPLDHTMVIRDDVGPNLALRWVIESGNIAQIRSLLQLCGPPENGMTRLGCYGGPLQVAIEIGSLEIFNALLEEGISPHAPAEGYNGMTALQAAAIFGRVGLAKLLIDLEVDVNAPGGRDDGRTALEGAAEHGHIDIIELLLQAGVAITGLGQRQYLRAIRFALSQCHYAAADMLKRYRKLSQEEVSMLDEKNLIRELPGLSYFCAPETEPPFSDCASSWSDCTEEEGRNFDVTSLDNSEAQTDEDFGVSNTETTFDEQEFHQKRQQEGEDISVIDIGIVADDLNLFGDGNSLMNELNSVPDITAPSEGIYNFDYPLFGIHEVQCDVEEEI
ncbi:hypothetical protein F5Y08DRAFT_347716 [Xylaria arbuscula]|nr:hypothetical protein F5Y08DRAFT_347716 [Xylaria arbuscula]